MLDANLTTQLRSYLTMLTTDVALVPSPTPAMTRPASRSPVRWTSCSPRSPTCRTQ